MTYLQKYVSQVKPKTLMLNYLIDIEAKINTAKTMVKLISCDCKCKFLSTTCNSNQKWNNQAC